ncbi:MAG: ABC transporter permease [Chloroflexota bacterium]|nr:MAG: ABC transporter permease [Chloroflexota bacterium]
MGLSRLSARTLTARPLRSLLTILGVALGVGVLSASLTLGAGLEAAINRTVRDLVGNADLRVSAFLERGLSDATVEAIRTMDGVSVAAPIVERRTFLSGVSGTNPGTVTVVGIDPTTYPTVHPLELVGGALLLRADERSAVITEALATAEGYALGSELTVLGAGAPTHLRVVGIVAGSGPIAEAGGRTVFVPIDVARTIFRLTGVTRVDVVLADRTPSQAAADRLAEVITTEPYVLATPADLAAGLRASTADFQATTAWLAAIVLFVGAFLIINTISMTVSERAREVGLLRAAGATRGQIIRFVLVGAAILGVLGSLFGLLVGAGLGALMANSIRALTGFAAQVDPLSAGSLALAFLVGLGVTTAGAMEPAIRASRISPVEALRARFDVPAARRGRLIWLTAVLGFVAVLALLVWPPASGSIGADRAIVVYGVLLVATLATPLVLPPLARIIGLPISLILRLEERLARGSMARDRSRTALTLGALVIGLAMVVALGWTADAARHRATAWLADVVPGDEVLTSIRRVGRTEPAQGELAALPGVRSVSPIATFDLAYHGVRIDAAAIVGADFLSDGRLTFLDGDRATALRALDTGGAAILPEAAARRLDLAVGDSIGVALGDGATLDLRIAGIVSRSLPSGGGEAILVGWPDASGPIGVTGADVFAVRFVPGATPAERAAVETLAATYALEANPLTRIEGAVVDALGRVFGLFDAFSLIALLVAALGIVNTLGMGVLERVRELGVLRAIGMTRRQASRMVVTEAIVLGLAGSVLGILVGLGIGAILLQFSGDLGRSPVLPWGSMALAGVLGISCSIVASYYPSVVAARVSIIRSLQFS